MWSREWGSKGSKGDFNCKITKLGFRANILSTTWKPDDKEKYFQVIQVIEYQSRILCTSKNIPMANFPCL